VRTAQLEAVLIREGCREQKAWPERRRMPMAKPRGLRTRLRAEATVEAIRCLQITAIPASHSFKPGSSRRSCRSVRGKNLINLLSCQCHAFQHRVSGQPEALVLVQPARPTRAAGGQAVAL